MNKNNFTNALLIIVCGLALFQFSCGRPNMCELGEPCNYNNVCMPGLVCSSNICVKSNDDGGVGVDAGLDGSVDAGEDSGLDASIDSGTDANIPKDASTDASDGGSDTGWDVGKDSGVDAGFDSGSDSGIDAGKDAGADAGIDGGKMDQTITFGTLSDKIYLDPPFNLTAKASSGLTVSYTSSNTMAASVTDTTVTIIGAGTTTITASQAGNGQYNAAPPVQQTLKVNKSVATVTLGNLSQIYNGTPKNATATTTPTGLTVNFTYNGSSTAPTDAENYTVLGTIVDMNYQGSNSGTLVVSKANQSITFGALPEKTIGDPDFSPGAIASSGLMVIYSSDNSAVATIVSGNIHIVGAGSCNITASQAGNNNYNAATNIVQPLTAKVVDCSGEDDFTPCTLPSPLYSYNICVSHTCVMPGCGDTTCNTPGPHFTLPPTTGSHFNRDTSVKDQPVVNDTITNLTWQGCASGITGNNCENNGTIIKKDWADALAYCDNLIWGGYSSGWRLPDIYELVSIVDYGFYGPSIDKTAFPSTPTGSWSSSSLKNDINSAWLVSFQYGFTIYTIKTTNYSMRCVRGNGETTPPSRFNRTVPAANQPIVYDTVTKLIWQGCPIGLSGNNCDSGNIITEGWFSANYRCNSISWGGYTSGWRLPNITELFSLVDNRLNLPSIDQTAFPATPSVVFWSSNYYVGDVSGKLRWALDFDLGRIIEASLDGTTPARCVRGP